MGRVGALAGGGPRARAGGGDRLDGRRHRGRADRLHAGASAKARTTRVKAGRSLAVSGTVRPLAPVTVTVEKQGSDGKWRKVATTTIRPRRARFTAAVALKRPGLYRLTPRTGSGAAKASAAALYVRAVRKASAVTGGSAAGV